MAKATKQAETKTKAKEPEVPQEESQTPTADALNEKLAEENEPKKGKTQFSKTEKESGSFEKRVDAILGSSKSDSDKLADLTAAVYKNKK